MDEHDQGPDAKTLADREHIMKRAEMAWARRFIDSQEWRFAKTMPQWPHWYIVRGEENRCADFDRFAKLIMKYGEDDPWGSTPRRYLRIAEHKYWVLGEIINRADPIPSSEVRRRGERWLSEHGKRVGPYGNLIPIRNHTIGRGEQWNGVHTVT